MKEHLKDMFKVILLIGIGLIFFVSMKINERSKYNKVIEIKKGDSISKTLKQFEENKEIYFRIYLKSRDNGKNIKAGYYKIEGEYSVREIVKLLEEGRDKIFKFTIQEGLTVNDIIAKLENEKRIEKEKFLYELSKIKFPYPTPNGNFEGYFYPETYFIPETFSEKQIIVTILNEFLRRFPEEKYPDKKEFYQKLIMASIVEREAFYEEEKPKMASVFYNRMKKGMSLGADSTVNFLYNYSKRKMYYKDLDIDSPYNTYKNKGLPPSPISNPDENSINAAFNPLETDYLFFVTKGGGEHFFSKTYKEHLDFQNRK